MEEITLIKIEQLKKAISNFAEALSIDPERFSGVEKDLIKNRQVQKFEFSVELMWKTVRAYLMDVHGFDTSSSKSVIKFFFEKGYLSYEDYEKAIKMIEDRNRLSHIYKETMFQDVYKNLKGHL